MNRLRRIGKHSDSTQEKELEGQSGAETPQPEAGSEVEAQTAPLDVEHEDLTPLPANAVIAGKYVVQSQLHHGVDRNLYRVAARRQQKCEACGRLSSTDDENCEHCGTELHGQVPADFYLMAESFKPEALMQDSGVMELRLYHPKDRKSVV